MPISEEARLDLHLMRTDRLQYRESTLIVAHIPITDPAHDPRGAQELEENLERIYQAFQQLPKPVLIHCSAGIDRTGRAVQYIEERLS